MVMAVVPMAAQDANEKQLEKMQVDAKQPAPLPLSRPPYLPVALDSRRPAPAQHSSIGIGKRLCASMHGQQTVGRYMHARSGGCVHG